MGHISFRPNVVSSWGRAAQQTGSDVRGVKQTVVAAEEDAGCAFASGLATKGASDRFTTAAESGVNTIADALARTGEKLLATANIVRSTDDASTDLFISRTGRHGGSRP